ncbi:MAG TPA: PAS domain S-box protein, partial [Anaerolineales bacterium]|nr:PAS domain S-box protein [Anaerolineales bacterium]
MVTKAMLEQENENLRLRVAHLEKQLATLKQEENEIRIHTKTGEEHIRIVNTHPLENNGQPLNFTTMQDVTEHKQAEEQRARLAERLDLATRSAQIGIWDWDIVKNEIVWDDQMYALYGLQPGEFGGAYEAWLHGVHPDDRETSNDVSAAAVRGEREYDTEFRVVWPDGSVHWLKANGEVFRNELGNPIRMVGVNYDVTERKRLEENFRESEKKYTLLFQKSAVPVFLIRLPEVRIADANEAAEHLTGYARAEMLGKNAAELGLISPKQRAETISTFEKEKALAENEMRITTKSGEECIIVINTNPLVIGGQPFAITTMQDIT